MRGEHGEVDVCMAGNMGSSPHARGTLGAAPVFPSVFGIIPACAGNTRVIRGYRLETGDHPRMRGEHRFTVFMMARWGGSSPHARGTHDFESDGRADRGIIPACAGNTVMPMARRVADSDHPRMRGEHTKKIA